MGGTVLHRSAIDSTNPAHSPEHLLPLDAEGAPQVDHRLRLRGRGRASRTTRRIP